MRVDEIRNLEDDLRRIAREKGDEMAEKSVRHFLLVKNVADRSMNDHRLRQAMAEIYVTYYLKGVAEMDPANEADAEMATHPHHYQMLGVEIAPSEHQMGFPDDIERPVPLKRLVHPNKVDPAKVRAAAPEKAEEKRLAAEKEHQQLGHLIMRHLNGWLMYVGGWGV